MYLYATSDQPLGFRLISLLEVDWSAVEPTLYRILDGVLPRQEADAVILNCGGGQFVAVLSAGDTSAEKGSYQLEADNCVSDEKSLCFFRSADLPFSITVEDDPLGFSYPGTRRLLFAANSGFVLTQPAPGGVQIALADATPTQRGAMGTGVQSFLGDKYFGSLLNVGVNPYPRTQLQNNNGTFEVAVVDSLGVARADFNFRGQVTDSVALRVNNSIGNAVQGHYAVAGPGPTYQRGEWGAFLGANYAGGLWTGGTPSVDWAYLFGTPTTLAGYGVAAVPWSLLSGTPNTLAGYGVASPLPLGQGGTGSDLSATGPGVLVQSAGGVNVSLVPPLADGDVLTGQTGVWVSLPSAGGSPLTTKGDIFAYDTANARLPVGTDGYVLTADSGQPIGLAWAAPASSGGFTVGAPIVGGTANRLVYDDLSHNVGEDAGSTYVGPGNWTFNNGTFGFEICNSGFAFGASYTSYFVRAITAGAALVASDGTRSAKLASTIAGVEAIDGGVYAPGVSGNTYAWGANNFAPTTQTLGSLPLDVYGAGAITSLLGTPDQWALVRVNGTDYRLPLYL